MASMSRPPGVLVSTGLAKAPNCSPLADRLRFCIVVLELARAERSQVVYDITSKGYLQRATAMYEGKHILGRSVLRDVLCIRCSDGSLKTVGVRPY